MTSLLQCDFYNWGHLEKVNQLDDRKITSLRKLLVNDHNYHKTQNEINKLNMDQNQPITTDRRDLLNWLKNSLFPERSVRVSTEGENEKHKAYF